MSACKCSISDDCCFTVVQIKILPLFICLALIYVVIRFGRMLLGSVASPSISWIPFVLIGVAVATWGLWLGYKVHGRGEPLAVGVFGIFVAFVGMLVYSPLLIVGALTVLVASIWSANLRRPN